MEQESVAQESKEITLHLARAGREELLSGLNGCSENSPFHCFDISLLSCELDAELVERLLGACSQIPGGIALRVAHNELGSGTDCEQRIFDCKAERVMRENEEKFHRKKKTDSSKEKDFTASATMRNAADEGTARVLERLQVIDKELGELERRKLDVPWYILFSQLESQNRNGVRCLDLSNCGLHATGLTLLTHSLLELEQRGEGERISELVLDGNDLGDTGMSPLASLLRLTSHLEVLRVRNIGATEEGVSQILSGLVSNKTLALIDLRSNGLCSSEVVKAVVEGVRRFNSRVEILVD